MKNDSATMTNCSEQNIFSDTEQRRHSSIAKATAVLVSLLIVISMTVGATLAYMFLNTGAVTNTFTAAGDSTPKIEESFTLNNTKKENVYVNVGDPGYAVYIRAKVSINWTKGDADNVTQEILALYPPKKGEDYSITYHDSTYDTAAEDKNGLYWIEGSDGYWYYNSPVSKGRTDDLIEICTVLKPCQIDGYTLQVDIMAQTIQAIGIMDGTENGTPAVTDAWGVTVGSDGKITVNSTADGGGQSGQ